jgi:DNA polymerase III alpha subunit
VIRVAHFFAGLTLAEADILRRGMSGKFRSRKEFERIQNKFFENCRAKEYAEEIINRVWYEIESFSGYSFSKGHSASYAVESYQSLYLKAHFPLEFMVGVINNFGGFYRTEFYFHEARLNGAQIEAPDVNQSEYLTDIQDQNIYTGFIHLKSLENKIAGLIPAERKLHGPYKSLKHFMERVPAGIEQIRILIRAGAFRFTGKSKQELLWEALIYFNQQKSSGTPGNMQLFEQEPVDMNLPPLDRNPVEDVFDEIELLGFPIRDPFRILDGPAKTTYLAKDISGQKGKRIEIIGYLITTKHTSTSNRQSMYFGTFMDAAGMTFDTVHFPTSAIKFPFRGRGFYKIKGKVTAEFDVYTIEADWMEKLPIINKRDHIFREEPPEQNFNQHQ